MKQREKKIEESSIGIDASMIDDCFLSSLSLPLLLLCFRFFALLHLRLLAFIIPAISLID